MANVGSDPTVAGCLFDGNVAAGEGGAVYGETDSDPFLLNCTLRGNTAAAGGGLWSGAGSTPRLQSCVVWGNVSPDPAPARRNIVGTTASVTYSAIEGGAAGTGNIAADPLFRAGTSDLGPGSPCRDAGLMLLLPDDVADVDGDGVTAEPAPVDAAGAPRVVGPRIDMGALEAQDEATPPSIVAVRAVDDGRLAVVFDEPLDPETSLDPLAYALDGGALVTAAAAGWLGRTVILDAAPLVPCTEHTLTVTGPTDVAGNALPAGSTWTFRMPALLLADGFDDGDLEGWTAVDVGGIDGPSDWQIERGRLVQLSNVFGYFPPFGVYDRLGAHLRPASPAAAEWADYSLSVRLGSGDDDGVGVVFRVLDDDSYYAFDMDAERSFRSLRRHHDGAASHLALATGLGYVPGREYLVRVEVMGGEIRVIVDDEDVFGGPVIDPAPIATGGAGPYTWAGDGAWFDDVVVLGGCD
jgi:predicted outer membrane repeat protein